MTGQYQLLICNGTMMGEGNLQDNKGKWTLYVKQDCVEPGFSVCVSHLKKNGSVEDYIVGVYASRSLACQAVSNVDPLKPEKQFKNGVVDKVKDTSKKYDPSEERWKWRARARYRNEMLHIGYYETENDATICLQEEMEDLSNLHKRYCDLMDKRARKRKREAEKKAEEKADENFIHHIQRRMNGTNEPPKKKRKKYRKRERVYLDPMPFYSNMQHPYELSPPVYVKKEFAQNGTMTRRRMQYGIHHKVNASWWSKCLEIVESFIQDERFSVFLDLHKHLPLTQKSSKRVFIDCPSTLFHCREKLANEQYQRLDDFINDFELIWINCRTFNDPTKAHALFEASHLLQDEFFGRLEEIVYHFGDDRCKLKWRNARIFPGGFLSDSEEDEPPDSLWDI